MRREAPFQVEQRKGRYIGYGGEQIGDCRIVAQRERVHAVRRAKAYTNRHCGDGVVLKESVYLYRKYLSELKMRSEQPVVRLGDVEGAVRQVFIAFK